MKRPKTKTESQHHSFIEAARQLGCDEDPAHFDAALKKVARHKPHDTVANEERVPKDGKKDKA